MRLVTTVPLLSRISDPPTVIVIALDWLIEPAPLRIREPPKRAMPSVKVLPFTVVAPE